MGMGKCLLSSKAAFSTYGGGFRPGGMTSTERPAEADRAAKMSFRRAAHAAERSKRVRLLRSAACAARSTPPWSADKREEPIPCLLGTHRTITIRKERKEGARKPSSRVQSFGAVPAGWASHWT